MTDLSSDTDSQNAAMNRDTDHNSDVSALADQIKAITDLVYAILLKDLKLEQERERFARHGFTRFKGGF